MKPETSKFNQGICDPAALLTNDTLSTLLLGVLHTVHREAP